MLAAGFSHTPHKAPRGAKHYTRLHDTTPCLRRASATHRTKHPEGQNTTQSNTSRTSTTPHKATHPLTQAGHQGHPDRARACTRGMSTHHQTYQTKKQGAPRPPPTQPTQVEPSGRRHTEMRATRPDSWQTPHPRNLHPTVQAGKHCHTRPNPHNPRHGHQPIDKFNSDQTRWRAIAHRLLHRVCHEGYGWRLLLTASRAPLLMCTTTLDSSMGVHNHH
jgi:hypothetical protein